MYVCMYISQHKRKATYLKIVRLIFVFANLLEREMKGSAISTFVILITIVVMVGQGEAAINCGQVEAFLTPCVPYLTIGGPPGLLCCGGVQGIKGMAITPEDKRTACNCVKAAAIRYPTLKDDAAQALPQRCGVKLDIPISRSSNCDIIN